MEVTVGENPLSNRSPDPIPLSLVVHTVFCERRAWLESVGERTGTWQVQSGKSDHQRTDNPRASTAGQHRALDIHHRSLGLIGRCDVVEGVSDSPLTLVEYKASPVRRRSEVTYANRIQLALQQLCLEDMGFSVGRTEIYFTTTRRRVDVALSDSDFSEAIAYVARTREIISGAVAPSPLEDDSRCTNCSHVAVCLPDERAEAPVTRRILVADPDAQVVHLATPGSRAGVRRGRLVVSKAGESLGDVPLERVMGLVVHGNVDVSSALIREMAWRDQTVVWCSGTGRLYSWSRPARSANGLNRVSQHVASAQGMPALAAEFVSAKIANQATLLRRSGGLNKAVEQLRSLQRAARRSRHLGEIFGLEGEAASTYFGEFPSLIKSSDSDFFLSTWTGRHGRGASDPLNSTLNYSYSLLTAEMKRAIAACGLDPHAGFLHSSNRNKPALALDLVEEFRAPVADSAVLRLINNGELRAEHFDQRLGGARLTQDGRRRVISGIETRMQTQITHPVFGYGATWRRTMEIQARMVLGVLDGSQQRYVEIRVR
ncbi:CRISPR-associated endonuclease Cas1 [Brevibacterium sp. UBA7493]|uniref:CRISPR-associated endonuclease Cas1 n=1 Tax=Brevibacterium sp. UBA7493 TaxID=1946121 RepID=UPI002579AB7D|nr:CRISPR-associated endonuclease Cas1 [Brevibacterium sp. UBA7493]